MVRCVVRYLVGSMVRGVVKSVITYVITCLAMRITEFLMITLQCHEVVK